MSEFGEPWWLDVDWGKVRDDMHKIVLDSVRPGSESTNRNRFRRRIIACINACAGVPTADLDRASHFMPTLAANLTAEQKAELLNKLETAGPSDVVAIPSEMEYRPAPLAWRKEPPDKPGWWIWRMPGNRFIPVAVLISGRRIDEMIVSVPEIEGRRGFYEPLLSQRFLGCLWAVPVEAQEAPK